MNLSNAIVTVITGLMALVFAVYADSERCPFPSHWKGKWYQNGLGEVTIRDKAITKKGSCAEHHRDYYLVKKRNEDCYQCLLIMERHENIIQYKEGYCVPRDTLKNICNQIQVESPLYTLVRDPARPTMCPFNDFYYFDYNDQASGSCPSSISYAKPCAGLTKYKMHFKHCKEWAMFNNADLEFTCLASWKDGSDQYLYGRFAGHSIANKDESYRCFKYEHFGTEIYAAMSVDATCQGLRTPRDGPVIVEFTKDVFGWPSRSCSYPHWLSGITWRDIEGKHTITFSSDSRVMIDHQRRRLSANAEIFSEHRCVEVLGNEFSHEGETVTVSSYTTQNCMSKHQCIRFKKNKNGRMEVFKGELSDFDWNTDSNTECLKEESYQNVEIWMDENAQPVECPMKGSYQVPDDSSGCHKRITIGCQNETLMSSSDTCGSTQARVAFSLQCLLTWQDTGRTYLLAKETNSRRVNCFSFRERHNTVQFTTDRKCGGGATMILEKSSKFELLERESCESAAEHVVLPVNPVPIETTTVAARSPLDYAEGDNPDYSYGDGVADLDFQYQGSNNRGNTRTGPSDGSKRGNTANVDTSREEEEYSDLAREIESKIPTAFPPRGPKTPYPKYETGVDLSRQPSPPVRKEGERKHHTSSANTVTPAHIVLLTVLLHMAVVIICR